MPDGYSRSRQRADEVRAQLEPLGPDDWPLGLRLAIALALLIALANIVGVIVSAGSQSPFLGLAFALLMVAAAAGMWQHSYLSILGFEALLAVGIIYAALSLLLASSLLGVLISVAIVAVCAPVFWLLIRVMARLQVPPK